MRLLLLLTAAAAAAATLAALALPSLASNVHHGHPAAARTTQVTVLRLGIAWQRSTTWRYQDRAGVPRTRTNYTERRTRSLPFLRWVDQLWSHRRIAAKKLAAKTLGRIAHWRLWQCIHGGEGNSHPSAAHPYSGPLQMTSYWAGYHVYDWSTVPVREVYADAEAQFRVHERRGDLSFWLSQQWPGTSGPCLAYA